MGASRRVWTIALTAVALLCSVTAAEGGAWVRVETPNFVVFGEVSEKRLRGIADEFERFREALGRIVPNAPTRSAVPTIVVVFNSQRSMGAYRPRFQGKPISLAGYFTSTHHHNFVALALENREQALRTIFHEYAHVVITNLARFVPVWLGEGLAEYYSSFSVADDGRTAIVARPIIEHLILLNQRPLIPHAELLAVDSESPLYNEGNRRSVFYAQSWALVHMLLQTPDRGRRLEQYLARVATGGASDAAWSDVFGDLKVNAELQRHITRPTMRALRYEFEQEIPRVQSASTIPPAGDVQAILASLLLSLDINDEATRLLEATVATTPPPAYAQALLGSIRTDQRRRDEAERLLLAAAADRRDWLVQYTVAVGLAEMLEQAETDERARLASTANAALDIVLAARPDLAHALALRATISVEAGRDLESGLKAIRRARVLAPGREDYVFEEARVLVEQREFEKARGVLGPLMTSRYHTDVREHARGLMAEIVRMEGSRTNASEPVFRKLLPGEERSSGLLEEIECIGPGVLFLVRAGDRLARFSAVGLEKVELISYRDDILGPVSCHRRVPPDPVYVTWRRSSDPATDGVAVAVEFLPVVRRP